MYRFDGKLAECTPPEKHTFISFARSNVPRGGSRGLRFSSTHRLSHIHECVLVPGTRDENQGPHDQEHGPELAKYEVHFQLHVKLVKWRSADARDVGPVRIDNWEKHKSS